MEGQILVVAYRVLELAAERSEAFEMDGEDRWCFVDCEALLSINRAFTPLELMSSEQR